MAVTLSFTVTDEPKDLKDAAPDGLGLTVGTSYFIQNDSPIPIRIAGLTAVPDKNRAGVHTLIGDAGGLFTPTGDAGLYVWTKSGRGIIAVSEAP